MSDPVTNVEIEDVLSSIRRLVSADDREDPQHRERSESAVRQAETRLVLTPAQRVDEAEADDTSADMEIDALEADEVEEADESRFAGIEDAEIIESAQEKGVSDEDLLKDLPQFIRRGFQDTVEEPAPLPESENDEAIEYDAAEEEGADALKDDWDDLEEDAWLSEDDLGEEAAQQDDASAEDETAETEEAGVHDPEDIDLKTLEARIAGFETAVAEKDDEWEPDGTSDDEYSAGPQSPLPWQDVEDEVAEDQPAEDFDPELEAELAGNVAEDDDYEDSAAAAEADSLGQEGESKRAGAEGGGWYSEDAILDEDALRDMVSEIVRQELQGALGERITRNVRKLVRREIHRALMSQGID